MGLFLDLAAVLAPKEEVQSAAENLGDRVKCCSVQTGRSLVLYEEPTGNFERVRKLSHALAAATFACHIHDEDLWLYEFYFSGELIDQFNTMPEYWGERPPEEKTSLRGDAQLLARYWPDLKANAVENYLLDWERLDGIWAGTPGKAYPEDQYAYGDCWQLTDFLRRLGTPYPESV